MNDFNSFFMVCHFRLADTLTKCGYEQSKKIECPSLFLSLLHDDGKRLKSVPFKPSELCYLEKIEI